MESNGSIKFLVLFFILMICGGCVQNGGEKVVTTQAEQTTIEVVSARNAAKGEIGI